MKQICFYIDVLLKRGFEDGFLLIEVSKTNYNFRFRKYINAPGNYGIELHIPIIEWSQPYLHDIISCSDKEKVLHKVENKVPPEIESDYLCVDFGKDTQKAKFFLKNMLFKIFKLNDDSCFYYHFENISIKDVLIDHERALKKDQV